VTALDVVAFTLPLLGWANKLLEVQAHRFTVQKRDDNAMTLGTEIDVQETDPSIYSWSTSEELTPEGYQQASTNNVTNVAAPTGVTLSNSSVSGTGLTTGQVQVTWTAPTDGFVTNGGQVIVQYSTDDMNWIALGTFDPSTTTAFVPNVAAGTTYWVRIAYINTAGAQSAWTVYGPITATGSTVSQQITLETNGANNALQNKLNLVAGSNISLTADGSGDVTVAATASTPAAVRETPSGTLNGSNTSYTLTYTPNPAASLTLWLNGVEQIAATDYTISGASISYTFPPKSSDLMVAEYTH
jgi:hypothetical protein